MTYVKSTLKCAVWVFGRGGAGISFFWLLVFASFIASAVYQRHHRRRPAAVVAVTRRA